MGLNPNLPRFTMSKKELYELGAEAKREIGGLTDKAILEKVSGNQGITLYDLAKALGWTRGKVLGSIQRLIAEKKAKTKTILRHGKVVRTIYTADFEEPKPGILEVPYTIIAPEQWKELRNAYAHALNRLSILIEPVQREKAGLFTSMCDLEHDNDKMRIKLPSEIIDFYLLQNSFITLSSIADAGDNVLATIEATTVPLTKEE